MSVVGHPGARQGLRELAGPPGGGGTESGAADLRHKDAPWLRAAVCADGLRTHLGPVRAELETAHAALISGAGELVALTELVAVRSSWERRIEVAADECAVLAVNLRAVARAQRRTNEQVRSSFARIDGGDDEAHGGRR